MVHPASSLKHLAKMPFLALSTPTAVRILKVGDAGHLATVQPRHSAALVHTQAPFSQPPVPGDPEPAAGTLEQRLGLEQANTLQLANGAGHHSRDPPGPCK